MPKRMVKVRVLARDYTVLHEALIPTKSKTMGRRACKVLADHANKLLAKFPGAYEAEAEFTHV